jgi:hypothetical protein
MNNRFKSKNKKGQVWTTDFIIGMLLFIMMLFVSVRIIFNMYPSTDGTTVYRDAVHLSDNLLAQGYPINWTEDLDSVVIPGIAENNRIDNFKLSRFKDLDYYRAKTLMHVTSDYAFFISNKTGIINTGQCIYGYNLSVDANCTPILTTVQYDTLARIDRVVIYNSSVVIMTIYAWN